MKPRKLALFANVLVCFEFVLSPLASPANAEVNATFTVTTNSDVVDATPGDGVCETVTGNGMCTLRAAIMEANALIGEDIIELPAATYLLTIPGADEDLSATGDLDITESVTITGTGYMDTVIDALNLNDRVIHILPTADIVTISGVKIRNGLILNHSGGGILNFSDLTLEDVYFSQNQASLDGGAICNFDELHVKNVTLNNNSASNWGGGIYTNSPIFADGIYFGNNTSDTNGGGLYATANATLDLASVQFILNSAEYNGGNMSIWGELTMEDGAIRGGEAGFDGGGIIIGHGGTATLSNISITDNHAQHGGGILIDEGATLTGSYLLFDSNSADLNGGAIFSGSRLTMHRSTFRNNNAGSGGAIYHISWLDSTISSSTLISNTATDDGGGVYNATSLKLSKTELSANHAQNGGAIYNRGTLQIENSTLSRNSAKDDGGGVYDSGGVHISIYKSTITANLAGADIINPGGEGGGVYAADMHVYFRNTILSGNHRRVLVNFVDDDCVGTLQSGDYNLIGTLSNCTLEAATEHNLIGADPLLGELADNGGPNHTHALLEGSPAIDGGNPEGCLGINDVLLYFDQRGENRPLDGDKDGTARCDIGSFELTTYVYMYLPLLVK